MVKKFVGMKANYDQISNSANTSVLRIPDSKDFFTLYQGGLPYRVEQKTTKQIGFEDFGFIQKGYSAHPKINPQNGDIYNIGFNMQTMDIYRMSKDFKLMAKNSVKLRVTQSIHDCCLAGDYLVVFECPVKANFWMLIRGYFAPKCFSIDYQYGKTIVHIFKKQTLQYVKKLEVKSDETFFMYHFSNGYQENNKLYVQYAGYEGENAQKLLDVVEYIPNYAVKDGKIKDTLAAFSRLSTLQINLEDFSHKFSHQKYDCQFPLIQDHQVGKKWQFTYFLSKSKQSRYFIADKLIKYDRFNKKALQKDYEGYGIVEPALIRTKQGLFILVIKTNAQKCYLQILEGEGLKTVCELELPEFIPFGFHGKWLEMADTRLLQSGDEQQ